LSRCHAAPPLLRHAITLEEPLLRATAERRFYAAMRLLFFAGLPLMLLRASALLCVIDARYALMIDATPC